MKQRQWFHMVEGPYDSQVFRLYEGPYHDHPDIDGFDELRCSDGSYVRPHNVDPYMEVKGKPNKLRTNIPHMVWQPD